MKKVYFAGSIRGGREDQDIYQQLIKKLSERFTVLTEHIGYKDLTLSGEVVFKDEYIYKRDCNWIKECDFVVAEVSTPSLGVGYEVGLAESLNKKVYCLYRKNSEKNSLQC